MDDVDHYFKRMMLSYQEQLVHLLQIPSISQKPEHKKDLLKIAQETAALAQSLGFKVNVLQSSVHSPAVVGKLVVDPQSPWILMYNHLDVQPADEPEWNTKPFEPVVNTKEVIARGATDDKGPMLATIYAIKYLHETKQLPVNVEIVYETYEENGSLGFGSLLRDALRKGLLVKPDSILVSDGVFLGEHPTIDVALRGLLKVNVSVQTAKKNIHSGLGGGVVRNPLHILITALAKCYDGETGKVLIPGFYQGVPKPNAKQMQELRAVAKVFERHTFVRDYGTKELFPIPHNVDFLRRVGCLPTFEIHDITGGVQGTKIPYYTEAEVSMRLVGRQDPHTILKHLRQFLKNVHSAIEVEGHSFVPAVTMRTDNPFVQKAAEAARVGFGQLPLYIKSGGTIGAFVAMQKQLPHVPIVMLNMSKASDGYHAPNEKFEWEQARRGMKTMVAYVKSIGELKVG